MGKSHAMLKFICYKDHKQSRKMFLKQSSF